jgi:hypothetical protein
LSFILSFTGEGVEEAFDWLFKQAAAHAYLDGAPRATIGPTFTKQDLEEVNRWVCGTATLSRG